MKFLKYLLGFVVFLLVGFFTMGLLTAEVSYDCDIVVDKPLAECWAVSQDPDKISEWLMGFEKMEHISGTPGTVGAVSDIYFNHDGQEMVIRETITEIVADESISMTFTSDFMDMDYTLSMASVDGKTKISSNTTAVGNGLFSKSIMALVGSSMITQEETNLSYLKACIESNSKDYFPVEESLIDSTEY
jgi:uncharacterized protein YndB with AHSA1/START domain